MNIYYTKHNVSFNEYWLQMYSYNICKNLNIPKIESYEMDKLTMAKINNMCIADMYGENWNDLPLRIKLTIHFIISELYEKGIVYPDITGYNFIEYNNKIWIIDFEHAFFKNCVHLSKVQMKHKQFVEDFIDKPNGWNDYFK